MGWIIATVCLATLLVAQGVLMVKQTEVIDEQMDLLKDQEESLAKCIAAWERFLSDYTPEVQKKGWRAAEELQRTIDEIRALRTRH